MTVRQFLRMTKALDLGDKVLTMHKILSLFDDGTDLQQASVLVDRELIFCEFLESLLKCALIKFSKLQNDSLRDRHWLSNSYPLLFSAMVNEWI